MVLLVVIAGNVVDALITQVCERVNYEAKIHHLTEVYGQARFIS